ncbi:MAG: prepilin-type N-terminal cleavage/methylation domain-containing protein [Planctomycetes bacterium]|nr:prepilin-type N-terminal cleavage/methylation domain-containing protein [Planctomycetota bacterium]
MGPSTGFTLIELMLVLMVLGLVYGIVFFRLDHVLTRYRLRGAARDILATMQLARSQAVSQQRPFRVVFDMDNQAFWLAREGAAPAAKRPLPEGVRIDRVTVAGRSRSSGREAVEYTSVGGAQRVRVDVASDDGRTISIQVDPLNAYAHVE